jgi:hypothetical protein
MGLFFWKGIEEGSFRAREDGDWDFFPNGALSDGYRVNAAQRERIAAGLRRFYGVATVIILAGLAITSFGPGLASTWPVLALLLVSMAGYWLTSLRPLWRGLPPAERRLGLAEAQTQAARTMPKSRIVFLLIASPLFGLLSLFCLWIGVTENDVTAQMAGAVGVLLAAGGAWAGIVMWRKRQAFERSGG